MWGFSFTSLIFSCSWPKWDFSRYFFACWGQHLVGGESTEHWAPSTAHPVPAPLNSQSFGIFQFPHSGCGNFWILIFQFPHPAFHVSAAPRSVCHSREDGQCIPRALRIPALPASCWMSWMCQRTMFAFLQPPMTPPRPGSLGNVNSELKSLSLYLWVVGKERGAPGMCSVPLLSVNPALHCDPGQKSQWKLFLPLTCLLQSDKWREGWGRLGDLSKLWIGCVLRKVRRKNSRIFICIKSFYSSSPLVFLDQRCLITVFPLIFGCKCEGFPVPSAIPALPVPVAAQELSWWLWCTRQVYHLSMGLIPHGQANLLQSFRLKWALAFRGDHQWFGFYSVPFSAVLSCIKFTADIKSNIRFTLLLFSQ